MLQVAQDIIWVWGENGPDAALESAMSSPALHKVAPGKKVLKNAVTQRDLPYGWDTFMENVMVSTHASHQAFYIVAASFLPAPLQPKGDRRPMLDLFLCALF